MGNLLKTFRKDEIDNLKNAVANNETYYYFFTSRSYPWPDEGAPPAVLESVDNITITPLNGLIFGKKLKNADIAYMVPSGSAKFWTTSTVYAQYDNTDVNLASKNFYVITDTGNVYKCLFNNRGVVSTVKPTLAQVAPFTTGDGYKWKYMFTVDTTSNTNFATSAYFPVVANNTVESGATQGIDVIEVVSGGGGYLTSTNGTIQAIDVANTALISLAATASLANNFYNKSTVYITSGVAQGAVRTIVSYTVNATGQWIGMSSSIPSLTALSSNYEINPTVQIAGDGTGAIAVCGVANGVIANVFVVNTGVGYTRATATIVANTSYGSGATLTAYVPPIGGHGKYPAQELGADAVGLNIQVANSEASTIITNCKYRTIGVLKNPKTAANTAAAYTSNTFSQVWKGSVTPATTFTANEIVSGGTTGARGYVVVSNTTVLWLTGDKNFANGEVVTGANSGLVATINSVSTTGDIAQYTPEILYLTNIAPITRSNTATDVIKLIFKL